VERPRSGRWHGVDVGLNFLKCRKTVGAAEPADAALFVAAFFEAIVDGEPGVGPHSAGVDLTTDAAGAVTVAGEHGCG
jgi:hypothetical protein